MTKPMVTNNVTPDQDAIISEIEIAAPADKVFKALTDPQQLIRWWGDQEACRATVWDMDSRRGGKWRFEATDPTGKVKVNGVSQFKANGEILEVDPPRLLVYTWIANWHDQPARRTVVRWELTPSGSGTKVKVTHSGLAEETVARKDYAGGWPGVVELLKKFVEQ
jgi:uncharacterized protein YndB with AHSA1/START domain